VVDTITIEQRGADFVLQAMVVKGYYPSFDIKPPSLVSGIVTDKGIYSTHDLHRYYENNGQGEYGHL